MSRPLSALALAVLLVVSVVAGVAGAAAGAQGQNGPPGHASIPDHAVTVGQGQQAPPGPSDPAAWGVSSSEHASDMAVDVRSPRASDRLELVFGDDANHAGREVAVSTQAIREALGRTPQVAHVEHESGDTYTVPVENNGETLSLELREFSENTVTFEGEVSIQGNPATDGAQYSYTIENLEDVANFSIDVTGSTATAWSNESATGFLAGSSTSIDVGGNTAPTGPSANGKPVLEVTGHTETGGTFNYSGGGHSAYAWGYDGAYIESEFRIPDSPSVIDEIQLHINQTGSNYDAAATSVDVYIQEGAPDSTAGNGNLVVSGYTPTAGTGDKTISGFSYEPTSDEVTVEFVTTAADTSGNYGEAFTKADSNQVWASTTYWDTVMGSDSYAHQVEASGSPSNVTADADDGSASASLGEFSDGQTKSVEFALSEPATAINWGGAGLLDYQLQLEEQTVTEDPTVEVNGQTTSHAGTLADGSTTSLATNTSWIKSGDNRVNVTLTAPASGPTPQVGLDYRHEATALQNTTFDGETWSERYNVSRTFGSDQNAATLTIPFSSDRVVAMRDVQHRVDGGSWQDVSNYQLDGTDLTVELGDVVAGETHEVRATGTKVQVTDGAITVLEPTYEGNTLDSKVRVDSSGSNFSIGVAGTEPSSYVHYTVSESWQGTPFAEVRSNGDQTLHLGPPDGGEFRVRTVPLSTVPESGHVSVIVEDGAEPEFTLQDHSSDVNVTYYDTKTGKTYALIDAETGDEIMRDTAESPVSFWAPTGTTTYLIDLASSTGGGATGGTAVAVASDSPLSTLAIFVGLAGSIVGFVFVGRKFGARGARQNLGLVAGGLAVAIVAIEAVTAGSFLGELAAGGGAIVGGALGGFIDSGAGAVVSGIGMFWAVYAVHERWGLPTWLLVISGLAIGVFTLDNVTDGALSGGLAEVSALLWLGIVFGAIALLWRVLQPRPIQIRGR